MKPPLELLTYDLEILECIPDDKMDERYQYCKGWDDHQGMTPTVIVTVSDAHRDEAWIWENPQHREGLEIRLKEFKGKIAGFNSINFDDKVMTANGIPVESSFDLLEEVRLAAGMPRKYDRNLTRKGYGLDPLARANGFFGKEGMSGADAPKMWQMGRKVEVALYCRNDAIMTHELIRKFLSEGLIDPTNDELLKVQETRES